MDNNKFHNEISRELGGVNTNLEGINRQLTELTVQIKVQNSRVRKLEDWKLIVKTQTALIATLVSTAIGVGMWILK